MPYLIYLLVFHKFVFCYFLKAWVFKIAVHFETHKEIEKKKKIANELIECTLWEKTRTW